MRDHGWFYLREPELADAAAAAAATGTLLRTTGVTDVVPSYDTVFVEYDPAVTAPERLRRLALAASGAAGDEAAEPGHRTVIIPTVYGGEHGSDLAEVARVTGLNEARVVALHTAAEYRVAAMGFLPGFAFMTGVPEALQVPRRAMPRSTVPAHSVAIANHQAGVYPLTSPGGWNLLGRALTAVYDPRRERPFLLQPGDAVRFVAAAPGSRPPPSPEGLPLLAEPRLPALKVLVPGLLDLVVDEGRFRVGRFGLARSGPIDPRSAQLANRLVANPSGAPVLELTLTGPVFEVLSDVVIAVTGDAVVPVLDGRRQSSWASLRVRRGQELSFEPGSRGTRAYLALAGGIESRMYLGSASVDLRGLLGSSLALGDVIGSAGDGTGHAGRSFRPYARREDVVPVRIVPGPQASEPALAALTSASFTVVTGDRTGVRLAGPEVPGGEVVSEGTPLGSVQVTSAGSPIILLHDRGTLGGYHKPAVVHPADLAAVGQLRPHQRLRFVLTEDVRTTASRRSLRSRRPTR